ncbi:hypothetical protein TMatcc_007829 [Talaromyces marneffei ATCC 18224]|uniref:Versicolorin B desaturase n=1 Tax=Talaromyces marneffei PM1 TaxID=1077442 RepID=A0A093VPH8_TALMA|nr:uncharacterized protein EYB26_004750 [Talaromyces marneffei]KAE8552784.1 hypothetical protein EYB25_004163 [Talaromyces marneffei]QGA17080.1 hypothetical protein EYB26_004750 [Talaromyces marneffei]
MTAKEIEANASILILGGSETTAGLLAALTYYMLSTPAAYKKLSDEIRGSFRSYEDIDFQGLRHFPYLNAALEESLRIYPPAPGTLPRIVPKGGAFIDGEFIPEGVSVSGAHYSAYHAECYFRDADSFSPDRWLDSRDTRFEKDCRGVLQPFSLGLRDCVGRNLAHAEMRLIAAKIIWSFDIVLEESSNGWNIQKSYTIWERKPLFVKLSLAQ